MHVDGSVFKLRELYKFKMGFVHFQLGQNIICSCQNPSPFSILLLLIKHEIITGFEDCNEVNEFREESQLRLVLLKKNFYNVDFR